MCGLYTGRGRVVLFCKSSASGEGVTQIEGEDEFGIYSEVVMEPLKVSRHGNVMSTLCFGRSTFLV